MHSAGAAPESTVHRFLVRVARRARLLSAGDGALTLATVALAVLLAGTAVRPAVVLFRFAPVAFAAAGLLALAAALFYAARALVRRVPLRRAALVVERRHPELRSDVTSALELSRLSDADYGRYGTSRPLVDAQARRASEAVRGLTPAAIVDAAPLRRRVWLPGLLAGVTALVAWFAPGVLADSARALVDPMALVPGDATVLSVAPGDATVLRGTPVTIRTRAAGRVPTRVEVALFPAGDAERAGSIDEGDARLLAARAEGDGLFLVGPLKAERGFRYRAQADRFSSPVFTLRVEEPPEVGRIAATYHYPDYLGLPDRRVDGGTVEAYLGTEVRFAMTANKPVVKGRVVFDDGSAQPLEVDPGPARQGGPEPRGATPAGTALAGGFVVTAPGGYRVVLTDAAGFETPEPIRYEIRVVPDEPPTAEIVKPDADQTVDQGDTVRVEWRAADDVALGAVDLVFDAGHGEQRVALARPRRGQPRGKLDGRHDWRLAPLRLAPGTRVAFFLEARDTDAVSGPKKGASRTLYLTVRSREQDHLAVRDDQKAIADALLEALGDQLEREAAASAQDRPTAEAKGKSLDQRLDEARQRLEAALARASKDPLADATQLFDMNLLRSHLDAVRESARAAGDDPSRQAPVTRDLEQLSSFADDIGKQGEMQDVVRRAEELMRQQTALLDKLDRESGKALDPKTKGELERALKDIEDRLRQLAEQLAKLPQSLPDEFMNSEAMDSLSMGDMADRLEQLREAIRKGDAEKARDLARQLAQQLNQMMAALGGARQETQQAQGGGQMARQMARQQGRLAELAREQRDIVNRTEELDRKAGEKLAQSQQREWGAFERQAREKLDETAKKSRDALRQQASRGEMDPSTYFQHRAIQEALRDAREQLDEKQARGLKQSLDRARDLLRRTPQTMMPSSQQDAAEMERLARDLSQLGGDLASQLSPQERQAMQQLTERQRAVGQATEQLSREVDDLSAAQPMVGPQLGRNLREAIPFMGDAAGQLGNRDARGALPPEREALQRLGRAEQAMQQAQQQMAQRGQMRGMNAPQMLAQQPGGGDMPGNDDTPTPRMDQREGGRAGGSNRDFRIPGREDYQVPRVYREQVINALKEPVPDAYRRKVERYFKNLTE